MKKSIFPGILILMTVVIFSCKKDYTIGGSITDPHVNMTTYDYLKTNPLFDTVLLLIDKTGLKDEVNASKTFFTFTDYAVTNYIKAKQEDLRTTRNDENLVYTFDSLDFAGLKDSLRAYMFSEEISRNNTTASGRLFKANDGELRFIQLIPSGDYTDGTVFSQRPNYLYFTKLIASEFNYPVPTDSTGIPSLKPEQLALRTVCQTSGIITTTGILHVLQNNHRFAFYGDENN